MFIGYATTRIRPSTRVVSAWTLFIGLAAAWALHAAEPTTAPESPSAPELQLDRLAPPTIYSPSAEHYRFGAYGPSLVSDASFYPIPQDPVTRETYVRFLDELGLFKIA
jgi:hypothetical protein